MRSFAEGYDSKSREMALSMREAEEEDMTTMAPCSRAASATQKPMPEDPPVMRTLDPASLDVYLVESVMMALGSDPNVSWLFALEGSV